MTLDEAIEILKIHVANIYHPELDGEADALKLGIEALRRIRDARTDEVEVEKGLMPGEPED